MTPFLKGLIATGMFARTRVMRRWELFLVVLFVCLFGMRGGELPEKLYFEANQLSKDGLVLEYRKSNAEATAKYLQARKLFVQILENYPTWQAESKLVEKKMDDLDMRLRPLLLIQGISPDSVIKPTGQLQAKTVLLETKPKIPPVQSSKTSLKEMSIDEEIAALRALQAKGETKIPANFGVPKSKKPVPSRVPGSTTPQARHSVAPALNLTEQLARLQVEKERANQALTEEQQKRLAMEAGYKAQLRVALAARPKALEPGEMAKQMSANEVLRKDFEYLKAQSKKGENELLNALEELEKARRENEFLRQKNRELQTQNQNLQKNLPIPR